jgi:mannosyltransferase
MATASRALGLLAPVAVALLAAGLGVIGIRRSFGLAEIEAVLESGRAWHDLVPFRDADASGSLYLLLLRGWLHVASSEWVARVPSLVAVGLAAAAVYALGCRLFDRNAGLAAGAVFAASASTATAGRTAGPLALALLAATLATLLFVVAIESGGATAWCAYALVAAASVYVHTSCALVLGAHAVALALVRPQGRFALVADALAAAVAAPAVVQTLANRPHAVDPLRQPSLADVLHAAHDASGRNGALLALALIGAAVIAMERTPGSEPWKLGLLAAWALVPAAGLLLLSIARPSLDARYLAISAPALALLAGGALAAIAVPALVAVLAAAVLALGGVRVAQLDRSTTEDWRAAVAAAFAAKPADERVVAAPARALAAVAYYAGTGRGSATPKGAAVRLLVRARADVALETARDAARAPAYALRNERSFGSRLRLQRWERTGLPAAP